MAHIIPNATDTGSGLRFANINQAEPDALDFEAISNRSNFIRLGGVTTQSNGLITVSAGVAVIAGVPYSFPAESLSNSAPDVNASNVQFSLLVARRSGGTVSVVKLDGVSSATNPVFPKSSSTAHSSDTSTQQSNYYNPDTDALLCAVYRAAAGSTVDGHLVDKRMMYTGNITWTQATAPTEQQGFNGDVVILSTAASTTNAVYVKAAGIWLQVANQGVVDDIVPVGMVVTWPANSTPPARFALCNGQTLPNDPLYARLAAAWDVPQPVTLPNYTDLFLRGGASAGTTGGSTTVSVPLKSHSHTLSAHQHVTSPHNHGTSNTNSSGDHAHGGSFTGSSTLTNTSGEHSHNVTTITNYNAVFGNQPWGFSAWTYGAIQPIAGISNNRLWNSSSPVGDNSWNSYSVQLGGSPAIANTYTDVLIAMPVSGHQHAYTPSGFVTINSAGQHSHTVTINDASGLTTGGPTTDSTSVVGDGTNPTITIIPPFRTVRYFVRTY